MRVFTRTTDGAHSTFQWHEQLDGWNDSQSVSFSYQT